MKALKNKILEEFDEEFGIGDSVLSTAEGKIYFKHFLSLALDKYIDRYQKKQKRKIGLLRQWLNEDRITEPHKIITNEDIEFWLE